jgi:hypothetical protein
MSSEPIIYSCEDNPSSPGDMAVSEGATDTEQEDRSRSKRLQYNKAGYSLTLIMT